MARNKGRTVSHKFILFCVSVFILVIAVMILVFVVTMQRNSAKSKTSGCAKSEDSLSFAAPIEDSQQQTQPVNRPDTSTDNTPAEVSIIPDPAAYPASSAFDVSPVDAAKPAQFGFTYEIRKNNRDESYNSNPNENKFSFGKGSDYTQVKGITTFAGNNYRSGFAYGTARVTMQTMEQVWSFAVGSANIKISKNITGMT